MSCLRIDHAVCRGFFHAATSPVKGGIAHGDQTGIAEVFTIVGKRLSLQILDTPSCLFHHTLGGAVSHSMVGTSRR